MRTFWFLPYPLPRLTSVAEQWMIFQWGGTKNKLHSMCKTINRHYRTFCAPFIFSCKFTSFLFSYSWNKQGCLWHSWLTLQQKALNGPLASLLPHSSKVNNHLMPSMKKWATRGADMFRGREKFTGHKSNILTTKKACWVKIHSSIL